MGPPADRHDAVAEAEAEAAAILEAEASEAEAEAEAEVGSLLHAAAWPTASTRSP